MNSILTFMTNFCICFIHYIYFQVLFEQRSDQWLKFKSSFVDRYRNSGPISIFIITTYIILVTLLFMQQCQVRAIFT